MINETDPSAPARNRLPRVSAVTEVTRFATTAGQAAFGVGRLVTGSVTGIIRGHRPSTQSVAHEVRCTFERLGPAYVKLGQLIASSPGVFGNTLSSEFDTLLDQVAPANPDEIRRVFIDDFGSTPEEVFADFDMDPIASASIAQVHTATLKTGEEVVVKIQRPGIAGRLAPDVAIMERLAG
ncbi:MAG: AarF/UbiB family protein, partial [Gordonia sp. (in: high G+C Gram-positive bacteria)]